MSTSATTDAPAQPRVGFVGLGNMGLPMARNIARAGLPLTVHNRSAGPADELAEEGVAVAASPAAVAAGSDVICLCVSDPAAVEAVVAGPDGVLAGARPGLLVIDFSTIDPGSARSCAALAAQLGVHWVDAPVSGGTVGAEKGTLTVMVGGADDDVALARPVLEAVGQNISHLGPVGAGSTVKLLNQMIVGITTAAVAEAMVLAETSGMDPERVHEVLSTGLAGSAVLSRHVPQFILPRHFQPGFALRLLTKDIRLAGELGREQGVPLEVTALVEQLLERAIAAGHGDEDMAALVRPLENAVGVTVGASTAAGAPRGVLPA